MNDEPRIAVLDASVAAKWYFLEELRPQALQVIFEYAGLIAPEFVLVEVANVYLNKARGDNPGTLSPALALDRLAQTVSLISDRHLIADALTLATSLKRSIYDSLYVALALQRECQLITADEKLVNALRPHLGDQIVWLGELSAG